MRDIIIFISEELLNFEKVADERANREEEEARSELSIYSEETGEAKQKRRAEVESNDIFAVERCENVRCFPTRHYNEYIIFKFGLNTDFFIAAELISAKISKIRTSRDGEV